jgi:hypothetical protein
LQIIPFYTLQFNALNADCFQVNVNPSMACESEADREVSSPFEVLHSRITVAHAPAGEAAVACRHTKGRF